MAIALGNNYNNGNSFVASASFSISNTNAGAVAVLWLVGDVGTQTATIDSNNMTSWGANANPGGGVYRVTAYYLGSLSSGSHTLAWTSSVNCRYAVQVYEDSGSANLTGVGTATSASGTSGTPTTSVSRPSATCWGITWGGMNGYTSLTNTTERNGNFNSGQNHGGDSNGVPASPFQWNTNFPLAFGSDWALMTAFIDLASAGATATGSTMLMMGV